MRPTARRIDGGQPLREAMDAAGVGLERLSELTRATDPSGAGVSFQLIAFLATEKRWARETTTPRTAELIEDALSAARGSLFEVEDSRLS